MQFTTLIPAYKPKYLIELLAALRSQTLRPARVIFSDDSPNQDFVVQLSSEPLKSLVADLNIEVVAGPRAGAWKNFQHLLQLYIQSPGGPSQLFHILLDDDIPYPSFYRRHLDAHSSRAVNCVVSRRWTASETGHPTRDNLPVPDAIANHSQRMLSLEANVLFAHTVGVGANWLGEFSNATFRSNVAMEIADASLAGISYTGLEDLGAFLKASMSVPLGFINEHLGFFRTSADQHSANPMGRPLKLAFLAYAALVVAGRNSGMLSREQSVMALGRICPFIRQVYGQEQDMLGFCELMPSLATGDPVAESDFLPLWRSYSGADGQLKK